MTRLQSWLDGLAPDAELDEEIEAMAPDGWVTLNLETVIRQKRPALFIQDDKPVFGEHDETETWARRIQEAGGLESAAKAVGRIETGPDAYAGTGWLIDKGILVTNRHVAMQVLAEGEARLVTDFVREHESSRTRAFQLGKLVHVEPFGGPDIAFFRVAEPKDENGELASPIELAGATTVGPVAVIGYPGADPRPPDRQLVQRVFGDVYNVKRLAPGAVLHLDAGPDLYHDASTLGGNSGSVVLDLQTCKAIGLHYGGQAGVRNVAIRCEQLVRLRDTPRSWVDRPTRSRTHSFPRRETTQSVGSDTLLSLTVQSEDGATLATVPLTIKLAIGTPSTAASDAQQTSNNLPLPRVGEAEDEPEELVEETSAASYVDREGYDPGFLGAQAWVPLPHVSDRNDVLRYQVGEDERTVLPYRHFSVVMSRSRRMCIYSAVNIDGESSRATKRKAWRYDPRIPKSMQIMKECYGRAPKFSRGHMTRREDPAWGATRAISQAASTDTMHVTNATPQRQAFNSPIWLGLENYALSHAREDEMRISVITGPYFNYNKEEDSVLWGVKIPRVFWKVIAFRHDDTGSLCATGYEMSQEDNLLSGPQPEHIFGDFVSPQINLSVQVPIATIEANAGLDFGPLRDADPLSFEEAGSAARRPLTDLSQVCFR